MPDDCGLLDAVHDFLTRFVIFPSKGAADAVTLWAAHTHALDSFDSTPRLALLSPEPGSGKSRTEEVLELLVPSPLHALNASTAAVFRSIEGEQPTLLFDEVDAIFGRHGKDDGAEDLRGLLNAGHRRGATIPRCVGKMQEVKRFPVFAAVALAGLGDLPDTLMSRSVIIRMRRRAPHERVAPFRFRDVEPAGHALRDRLASWAAEHLKGLADARPAMPPGVEDRPADCWEPLLAVADSIGGDWPVRARAACVELVKIGASREASLGIRLLTDMRAVFGDRDVMDTEGILEALRQLDEAPWGDLRGKPLDPRGLARRLREYGVASVGVRIGERTPKGYRREDLWDAWERYLPAEAPQAQHTQRCRAEQVSSAAAAARVADTSATPLVQDAPLTSEVAPVADVAHLRTGTADCGHPVKALNTANGRCALCIAARPRPVRACAQPLDPAALGDDVHSFCEIEESA